MDRHECDVLVAGSGAGGFSAAITAAHAGLNVLMVEKEPLFGGTTAYSAGVVWIPMSEASVAAGIADSAAETMRYLESEVGAFLDRPKADAFIANAAQMLAFFERETHVRYLLMPAWSDYHPELPGASQGGRSLLPLPYDGRELGEWFVKLRAPIRTMMLFGGMSVSRDDIPHLLNFSRSAGSAWHVAKLLLRYAYDRLSYPRGTRIANGNALIARMAKSAFEKKVALWLESPLLRLSKSGERVTGAIVRHEGREIEIVARRGVVLASGGFPGSAELRARHYRHVAAGKNHSPLAPPGNTGDGARAAREVGGVMHVEQDQPAAWTPVSLVPQPDGSVVPYPHFIDRCKPGYIAVDRRGRRFANEAESYHDFVQRLFAACEGDSVVEAWLVCDHRALRRYGLGVVPPAPMPIGAFLRSGYLVRGASAPALAAALGIDASAFERTLARYNEFAARGEDPDFGKGTNAYHRFGGDPLHKPNPNIAPIVDGPFYAVSLVPGDLGTFVGIATDPQARVLDVNENPIPGLYAVGNDQASVMGGKYPGAGITIGPAMTFGYIAGRQVAAAG